MEPMDLITFRRNSELTIDATINGLDGDPADITSLATTDIRWGIARSKSGPRLATLSLTSNDFGVITKVSPSEGTIRIQFTPTLPPEDDDDFAPGLYYHECTVNLSEASATQFWGRIRIQPSIFAEDE